MTRTDDELLAKPIIVIGAGRSGMNFLGDVIARQGSLAVATEPRLLWKHGNDAKSDALEPEDARPEVIRDIRARLARIVREQGKDRLIDVTPGNSVRLGFVERAFPDCRFVHFVRDGVDNILSMRRFYAVHARKIGGDKDPDHESPLVRRRREIRLRQIPGLAMEVIRHLAPDFLLPIVGPPMVGVRLPAMMALRREVDLLDLCFRQWRASVEMAAVYGRNLPPDRYMECRIETFSAADVKPIFDFCELEVTPDVLDFVRKKFDASRIGPAMSEAFPEELERLKRLVRPTMQWVEQGMPSRTVALATSEGDEPVSTAPAQSSATADHSESTEAGDPWVEWRAEQDVAVVTISVPRLDPKRHRKADYDRALTQALDRGHKQFVLDFSNFRHTNHVWGLFQLVFGAFHPVNRRGGSLVISGLRGHPRRVYYYAELNKRLASYKSVSAALSALGSAQSEPANARLAGASR